MLVADMLHGDGEYSDPGESLHGDGVAASMPSKAASMASGFIGDLVAPGAEMFLKPVRTSQNLQDFTDGAWKECSGGDGGDHSQREGEGAFGVLCENWGGSWNGMTLQEKMVFDLKGGPCHILTLQEANEDLLLHLD